MRATPIHPRSDHGPRQQEPGPACDASPIHVESGRLSRLTAPWPAELIDDTDRLPERKRAELRGAISDQARLARLLRTTSGGLLRIDAAAIKAEERLDGTYLLRCSDPRLSAEEIATATSSSARSSAPGAT